MVHVIRTDGREGAGGRERGREGVGRRWVPADDEPITIACSVQWCSVGRAERIREVNLRALMATTYKVLKTTHLRSQPSAKDKGSKISKGDVVVVTAKEVKPDGTWVQLEGGKWASTERGSDVLLKPITQVRCTLSSLRFLLHLRVLLRVASVTFSQWSSFNGSSL